MKLNAICLAMLPALLACSAENADLSPDMTDTGIHILTASISDGLITGWTAGDIVTLLHDGQFIHSEIQSSGRESALRCMMEEPVTDNNPLFGVYPADAVVSSVGQSITIAVPASQTGANNGYDEKAAIYVAGSVSESLDFHTLCGGLHLKFSISGVTKIELESVDGYPLAGNVKVTCDTQGNTAVDEITEGNSIITFNAPDNTGFIPGTDYFISTLPCDVSGGYRLSIYKGGLVAHYFGVHQTIDRTCYITPDDLNESELTFDDPDAPLVEEDRPELDATTSALLRQYQQNPTDENKQALLSRMGIRYDKVVARKKAKLRELEREAKTQNLIDEMKAIVDEMVENREIRLEQQFLRLIDPRTDDNPHDCWMVLRGASAPNAYIAYTPVTNAEYKLFAPEFIYDNNMGNYPAVNISVSDAISYCDWLSALDSKHLYRLPTDEEWIMAAGHMPKDISMNSGHVESGLTPVDAYKQTVGACGGIDFWGNCWEWTSSTDPDGLYIIKGGSWDSDRDDCRSEKSDVVRQGSRGYANVGFRVVRTDR